MADLLTAAVCHKQESVALVFFPTVRKDHGIPVLKQDLSLALFLPGRHCLQTGMPLSSPYYNDMLLWR